MDPNLQIPLKESKKDQLINYFSNFKQKMPIKFTKLYYLSFLALVLAIPVTVSLVKINTNTSTNAQSILEQDVAQNESMIIPAPDVENDEESYIPPPNNAIAQKILAQDEASDQQVLNSDSPANVKVSKPNIVFLLLDDAAYMDDRVWNRLPIIKDLFIDHGARFTNFYGETPLCCPGRAGFLTGQHTFNNKVVTNDASLFNPKMTIATQLHSSGYYTFLAGKYLNLFDAKKEKTPGWDNFSGFGGAYYKYYFWNNGIHVYYPTQYSTDVVATKTMKYLKQAPNNKPLFAWVTPYAVHEGPGTSPYPNIPKKYIGDSRCKNIPKWLPPNYNEADMSDKPAYNRDHKLMPDKKGWDIVKDCEALLPVEELVKKMKAELIRQGRLQNTIFILGVDNGMDWGAHRYYGKVWPYADQVNFFVHWPAGIGTAPYTVSEAVRNIDLAPTLCEIGGCTMGPYPNGQTTPDGISFLALLKRQTTSLNRDSTLEDFIIGGPGTSAPMPPYYALRTTTGNLLGLWHYIEYSTGEKELYDVSHAPCISWTPSMGGDPCELNNLLGPNANPSSDIQNIASKLSARLAQLKVEKGYVSPTPTSTITPTPTFMPTQTSIPSPTNLPTSTPTQTTRP